MRAKFVLTQVEPWPEEYQTKGENFTFSAVTEKPFDESGTSEDNDFARWTPTGTLTMSVTNPNLIGKFKTGQRFYLDFTEAKE